MLAAAIGKVARLAETHYECQVACFDFIGQIAGFQPSFAKWAALERKVPGFLVFKEATALVDSYLSSNDELSLKKAKQIKDADEWLEKFRAMPAKLVIAMLQVRSEAYRLL